MESPRSVRAVVTAVVWALIALSGPSASGPATAHASVLPETGSCAFRLAASPVAAPPVGAGPCHGVRPGAYVAAPQGGCTLNFVFRAREKTAEGTRSVRYVGTAGHCALGAARERSWAPNKGPKAFDVAGRKIGEFVYAVLEPGEGLIGAYRDFALIRLDGDVKSSIAMCHFGGPTGINADMGGGPVVVHHYGQGLGWGETIPARTSVVRSLNDPDVAGATGAINYGDSGAGVISADGRALGVVVQFIDESGPDLIGITRIRPQMLRAEKVLDVDLTLLKAALS